MIELFFKAQNDKLTFKITGNNQKEIWQQLSEIQEVFACDDKCGLCQKSDLRFVYRKAGKYSYYELMCKYCKGKLGFGQHNDTETLFPQRVNTETKEKIGKYGWHKWEGNK